MQFTQEELAILAIAMSRLVNDRPIIEGYSYRDFEEVADRVVALQETETEDE